MKTILITGAAGFIGSTLADFLIEKGNKVINVDCFNDYYDVGIKEANVASHNNDPLYKLYRVDITDYLSLKSVFAENKIDAIVHLAARAGVRPSIEDPVLYQNVNGLGTTNLLELAKNYGIKKIVLASSSSVYGNNTKAPFSETDIVDFAISPYAATKKANEVLAHVYHHLYDMDILIFRFFTVYGPRQRPDLAINKFTQLVIEGKEIPIFGDGTTSRDYTYVDDIVDGIYSGLQFLNHHKDVYEIVNLGSNNPITLLEMIRVIEKATEKKAVIKVLPMQPGDVNKTYADISKARTLLGYSPKVSFEEGVSRFYKWYIANQEKRGTKK